MKLNFLVICLVTILSLSFSTPLTEEGDWGFWAHRRINRLAVFSLPPEMIGFYKKHIEYITEHAVDPDKRRYATKHEGPRHFIDIDHWGNYPFPEVPRDWTEALAKYTDVYLVNSEQDTVLLFGDKSMETQNGLMRHVGNNPKGLAILDKPIQELAYIQFFKKHILPQYYNDQWVLSCDTLSSFLDRPLACDQIFAVDRFSEYGISPYNMLMMQNRLTRAFRARNEAAILRFSAEIGHYIGDGHVPLHTTENYNGQLTDQVGIHAFWESRIPELFADEQYDYFVGPANYIDNPKEYYWQTVLDSHQLLDSVLIIEKELSQSLPEDKQYCYEERLGRTIRTQCKEYAAAYQNRMDGMVENRMRDAILSIASAWFTAWVDAGQPNLNELGLDPRIIAEQEKEMMKSIDNAYQGGEIKGRAHN